MARRLKCPRCGSTKYWIIRREKRRCVKCRYEWRPSRLPLRLSPLQWRRLLGWFVRSVRTAVIAEETGLHRQRVLRALTHVRQAMASEVSPGFQKEVQFHAIYLGGHPAEKKYLEPAGEKREGGDDSQARSFAIVWHNGKVRIELVSYAEAEILLPLIPKPVRQDSSLNSDFQRSLQTAEQQSDHQPSAERQAVEETAVEESQINRLRGFWGYLKRQLAGRGGIRRERLPLYLAEYVWRYNSHQLTQEQQVRELLRLLKVRGRLSG